MNNAKKKVQEFLESKLKNNPNLICTDSDRLIWLSDVTDVVYEMLKELKQAKIIWPAESSYFNNNPNEFKGFTSPV